MGQLLKITYLMTFVRDGKEGFILDHHDRYRDHYKGILQLKQETELNSEYGMGKGEFIVMEKDEGQGMEIIKRKHQE